MDDAARAVDWLFGTDSGRILCVLLVLLLHGAMLFVLADVLEKMEKRLDKLEGKPADDERPPRPPYTSPPKKWDGNPYQAP